jgi:hypothetical protein
MNLTWHIARKDFRRFWIPLVILIAIAAMRFCVGVTLLKGNAVDSAAFGHRAVYANVLWGVGLFVTYMLVAAIIQEDSVASAAFWQTRPISRARLFAAKALVLTLVFGLLPVVLSTPWWIGCGFGPAEIARAAGETLAIQMGVVILALPWAAITGNYGRFLLWTLVAAIAWVTAALLLSEHVIVSPTSLEPGVGVTRLLVIALLAGVGGLGVAIHQFFLRRTWRSVAIILCVAATMAVVSLRWQWSASSLWDPQPVAPGKLAADVGISFERAFAYTSSSEGNTMADVSLTVTGLPKGYSLSPVYAMQDLRWADGSLSEQRRFDMWGWDRFVGSYDNLLHVAHSQPSEQWMWYARRHTLYRMTPENDGQWTVQFPMILSPSEMKKLRGEKPRYDGVFWFSLLQGEKVGEGEIRPGMALEKGTEQTRIAATSFDDENQVLWLSLVERSPEYLWTDFLRNAGLATPSADPTYGVVNPARTFMSWGSNDMKDHALIANVAITLRKERFGPRSHWNAATHTWEKERTSFNGATLAEVLNREAERFSLPVTVDHFAFMHNVLGNQGMPLATFTVSGEVARPGAYRLYPRDTVVSALRYAGGVSDSADLKAVVLTHTNPDGTTIRTVVNVDAWLDGKAPLDTNLPLQPGDTLSVPTGTTDQAP